MSIRSPESLASCGERLGADLAQILLNEKRAYLASNETTPELSQAAWRQFHRIASQSVRSAVLSICRKENGAAAANQFIAGFDRGLRERAADAASIEAASSSIQRQNPERT